MISHIKTELSITGRERVRLKNMISEQRTKINHLKFQRDICMKYLNEIDVPQEYNGRKLSLIGRVKMALGDFNFDDDNDQYA